MSAKQRYLARVLIVDDETELANALRIALTAQGYEASSLNSPLDALEVLREQEFDLLLTDLMMPEMDGIALLQAAMEIDPQMACILMTGQGTVQTAVEAMKVGALDYILKPFKVGMLLPVLNRALEVRQLRMENIQLKETLAVFELGQTIAYSLDLDTLMHKAADAALKQLDADEVSLMLPTEEGNELYVAAVRGGARKELLGTRVPLEKTISGWVANHREPLTLEGEIADERFSSLFPRKDIATSVSMPMLSGGKLIGVLNVNSTRRRSFSLGQVKGLNILANTAASALRSATLFNHLQSAEEQYRSIFRNAAEGIFQATENGRFIVANPALSRIFGYDSPEELISSVHDIAIQLYTDPVQRSEFKRLLQEQGYLNGFEAQCYRKDGRKIWTTTNARRRVEDETGRVFYEGTVEDITQRKEAEQALNQQVRFLQILMDSIPNPIYVKNVLGKYEGCNKAYEEFIGINRMDLINKDAYDVEPRFLADKCHEMDSILYSNPGTQTYETSIQYADGSIHDAIINKASFVDGGGAVAGLVGVILDITERKRAEETLKRRERYYRSLLYNLHEDILVINRQHTIVDANRDFLNTLLYTREELVGKTCHELLHGLPQPCDHNEGGCSLRNVFLSGLPCNTRHEHIRKDGSKVWVDILYSLSRDEAGEADNAILAIRDVTREVEMDKQYRQAQKMEAIGTLAGGIAHDFNNILGIILGYTEVLLLDAPDSGETRENLQQTRKAAFRAKELVNQILSFSRKNEQERAPLHLKPLLKEILKLLRAALPATIEIRQSIDGASNDQDTILADPTQIHQVVMNLCTNAAHAMRETGGILQVGFSNARFGAEDPTRPPHLVPGLYTRIDVKDTGCGMDESVLERIFEPYFTTKVTGEGTGLGLSVVHGIVSNHNGTVTVKSSPGMGSTFTVFLPVGRGGDERLPEEASPAVAGGKETILLVDDEVELLLVLKEILARFGYTVYPASKPEDALKLFRESPERFDLIISDQTMPQMTGIELTAELRSIRPDIPVVLCTGFSELVTEENLQKAGITRLLLKPLVMHELGNVVRQAIEAEPSAGQGKGEDLSAS